jgi:hypothetical protein
MAYHPYENGAPSMARKLTLRKDTLSELSTADLTQVAGAAQQSILCNLTESCLPTCGCTGYYPSIFDPCNVTN